MRSAVADSQLVCLFTRDVTLKAMEQICGGVKQKLVFKAQNKSTCYDICIPVARAQHDIKMVFPSKETLAIFARKTHLRGKSNSH